MPEDTANYIPLDQGKIAALRMVKEAAKQTSEASLRTLIDRYAHEDNHGWYIVVKFKDRNFNNRKTTQMIGITSEGEFFSCPMEGHHDALPADARLHFSKCNVLKAFQDLSYSTYFTPKSSELREEVKRHYFTFNSSVAEEMDAILTYTPTPEDEDYTAIAYHQIGKERIWCAKSRTLNEEGYPCYMVNSSTEPEPFGVLGYILAIARKQEPFTARG